MRHHSSPGRSGEEAASKFWLGRADNLNHESSVQSHRRLFEGFVGVGVCGTTFKIDRLFLLSPQIIKWRYLVYLRYWTLSHRPLIYPKVLFPSKLYHQRLSLLDSCPERFLCRAS